MRTDFFSFETINTRWLHKITAKKVLKAYGATTSGCYQFQHDIILLNVYSQNK